MDTNKYLQTLNADSAAKINLLETILSSIPANVYWVGVDGERVVGCNMYQALALKKQDTKELIGKSIYDFASKESAEEAIRNNLEVIKSGKVKIVKETLITQNGDKMVVLSHKAPLRDQNSIIGVVGTSIVISKGDNSGLHCVNDFFANLIGPISEYTAIAEYIVAIESYYESIIWQMPEHVYWTDKDGFLLGCNNKQAYDSGVSSIQGVIGKNISDFMSKEQALLHQRNNALVLQTGEEQTFEETWQLHNGKQATYISKKIPIRNKNKEILGVLGISVDITDRKQAEEELRIAKERAELAHETQTQFIQNMEHDLRTPASGVSQMLHYLTEEEKDANKKDVLQKLANASQRLLDLLNDIIAFDKINLGQLPVEIRKFDLYDVIHSIIDLEMPSAQGKHIALQLSIADNVPKNIISDKSRVFRILLNLVGNAVKFTKEGGVKVNIEIGKQIDAKNFILKLVVEDTGIGIPEDKRHRIYERFERCIPSNKGLYPGSGLGLSITRQFVEELHGEIEVKSVVGQGTTFTCLIPCSLSLLDMTSYEGIFPNQNEAKEFPIENKTTEAVNTSSSGDFSKFNILVVEDDPIAQMSVCNTLENSLHVNFSLAETGHDALGLFSQNQYDLIFMDLGLPDMTGNEAASTIRKTNKQIPIIALTAHDKPNIRELCKNAGMNDFLVKPLDVSKASIILQKWLLKENIDLPLDDVESTSDNNQVLNFELCTKVASGNKNTAKKLWQVFSGLLPNYLNDFENAYKNEDIQMLFHLSHKLKGAATYAGAPRLHNAASELCEATRSGEAKISDVKDLYDNVCTDITEVSKLYQKLGY